jgi:hypothetical protein
MSMEFVIKMLDKKTGNISTFKLLMPEMLDNNFYRQMLSFDAFFNGRKRRNHSDIALYTANNKQEYLEYYANNSHLNTGLTFNGIWEFYKYIGYDYKTKKYIKKEMK